MSGYDILKAIKLKMPSSKIIMMTAFGEDEYIRYTFKHGAVGFINKTQGPQDVLRAISIALQGDVYSSRNASKNYLFLR